MAKNSSVEEKVEDYFKKQLDSFGVKYYAKTDFINDEIKLALYSSPSKSGGAGNNYVDIKVLLQTKELRIIPVMIEAKGSYGDLIKEVDNQISLKTSDVKKYAVNGAVHYAKCILDYGCSYEEVIAIGINGYEDSSKAFNTEIGAYYLSKANGNIPKKIGDYSDLSFLKESNHEKLCKTIDELYLTEEEKELVIKEIESKLDKNLREINQIMQDTLQINVTHRVNLITGMIMAGLGVKGKVSPLKTKDLQGDMDDSSNDGVVIMNKIEAFLKNKSLPSEKKQMIVNTLKNVFVYDTLWKVEDGESKLKQIYSYVEQNIMPIFHTEYHIDFTGKLFNVLNDWVSVPDGDKNDVVFTPRYVTDMMAKIAKVNMNSYVWDYATGSAGFLVSSMKLMLADAQKRCKSPEEYRQRDIKIKTEQLLGIEKLSDIYMLAVLNMILMGDGSSNIIHKNALTEYTGKYEQGPHKDEDFPANVFLLNPPYSAEGKGFIFVKKALDRMQTGRAVILIQENAGSGNGLPYTKQLLEKNKLVASIHMSDIFKGKAGVQTAVYVFDVGTPHDEKDIVKFIDFSNDGYTRQNRKKSSQETNLKNTDHAIERYQEIVDLVLNGKKYLHYFNEEDYIEDTISLDQKKAGTDWTFAQHKKIDLTPTEEDFKRVVSNYLAWKVSQVLTSEEQYAE